MRILKLTILLSLIFVTLSNAELYIIAHSPYGGGWGTRLLLTNGTANPVSVELDYFTQAGQPAFVPFEGSPTAGVRQLQIGPNQVETVATDPAQRNASDLQITWAVVRSNGPLNIFNLFDYAPTSVPSSVPSTKIVSAVGATSTAPGQSFRFPVFVNGVTQFNSGMALANPNSAAALVSLNLLDKDGVITATRVMLLPPNGQTSFVLTDAVAFKSNLDPALLFRGSVGVCANIPIGLAAIGSEGSALFTVSVSNDYRCN